MRKRSPGSPDADLVHRVVLTDALLRALAEAPETRGLALPPEFGIDPTPEGHLHFQLGPVDLVDNSRVVHDAWNTAAPGIVRPSELHDAVEMAHLAIRRAAQRCEEHPPASWKVLIHPVALALALGHDADRTRYPLSLRSGQRAGPTTWDVNGNGSPMNRGYPFTATAECALRDDGLLHVANLGVIARRTSSALGFHCFNSPRGMTHSLSITGLMPEVLRNGLHGRRLGELVELPATGHPEVDAAAHACRIAGHQELPNGVALLLGAARHIPYGEAPDDASARAMRLAPIHL